MKSTKILLIYFLRLFRHTYSLIVEPFFLWLDLRVETPQKKINARDSQLIDLTYC